MHFLYSGVLDTHYNTSVASTALSSKRKLQRCGKLVERRVDDDVGLDRVESSTSRTRGPVEKADHDGHHVSQRSKGAAEVKLAAKERAGSLAPPGQSLCSSFE